MAVCVCVCVCTHIYISLTALYLMFKTFTEMAACYSFFCNLLSLCNHGEFTHVGQRSSEYVSVTSLVSNSWQLHGL